MLAAMFSGRHSVPRDPDTVLQVLYDVSFRRFLSSLHFTDCY